MSRDAKPRLLDVALNEMVQHGMNRENRIRFLRFDKAGYEFARVRVEEFSFIGPAVVYKPEVVAHPLGPVCQDRVVETAQRSIEFSRFFDRLSNRNLKPCRGCRRL